MNMKSIKTMLFSCLVAFSAFVFNSSIAHGAAEPVIIGSIAPATGNISMFGQSVVNGVRLAIEEINASGGVLGGRPLELVFMDDRGDPTEGVNAYNRLIGSGVKAIIGPVTSSVGAGIAERSNTDNMLMLTPTGTADSLTVGRPSVFRTCYTDSYQGRIVARFAFSTLGVKKIAAIYCGADEYSLGLYESFKEGCEEVGIEVIATEISASMDDVDFSAQLSNITVSDAEAIFAPYYYNTIGLLVPQAREAGFEGAIIGADGWDGIEDRIGDNAAAFNNTYYTNFYAIDDPAERVQNFVKVYSNKYGNDGTLNGFSALGYDSAHMIAQAINEANSDDTSKIIESMQKLNFSGATGVFTFDENGNPQKGAAIIEMKDGVAKWSTTIE